MYLAKMSGSLVEPGTTIEITGVDDFKCEVLAVHPEHFDIKWLLGENKGKVDKLPFSIFGHDAVSVFEVKDSTSEPNKAWLYKRMTE